MLYLAVTEKAYKSKKTDLIGFLLKGLFSFVIGYSVRVILNYRTGWMSSHHAG